MRQVMRLKNILKRILNNCFHFLILVRKNIPINACDMILERFLIDVNITSLCDFLHIFLFIV